MYNIFDKLYICGYNELEILNLCNFKYIINCSTFLNGKIITPKSNFIVPTVLDANLDKQLNLMIITINQIL